MRTMGTEADSNMSQEIAAALIRFFGPRQSIAELREALARHTWNIALGGTQEDREFVGELELALAEYEAGHISFEELATRLSAHINGLLLIEATDAGITTGAEAKLIRQELWTAGPDIQPSWGLWSSELRVA